MSTRVDQRVLRWFGHLERMDKECKARRMSRADVSGARVRGGDVSYFGWIVQQRDECGSYVTMREGYEGLESPGAYCR